MRYTKTVLLGSLLMLFESGLHGQTPIDMALARVIGQTSLTLRSTEPNLVEGRELNGPQGVAIDTSASPPIVYVSDTFNNRVLAWRDASAFQNGAPADAVIGQLDMFSTDPQGPANDTPFGIAFGLWRPTGLAVDAQGNLYVVDARNNRILRYPKPFAQADPVKVADQVIGQPSISTLPPDPAATTATSLRLSYKNTSLCTAEPDHWCPQRAAIAFDGTGNLWVTDAGNHRVLRFPWDPTNGRIKVEADLVLGQSDFTTGTSTNDTTLLNRMNTPAGLAFDGAGRLLVADAMHRVLLFIPSFFHFFSGQSATRVIGGVYGTQGRALSPPNARSLNTPGGVRVLANGDILVADMLNHRVLRFPGFDSWPSGSTSPTATAVIGQPDFVSNTSAAGASGLSGPVDVAVAGNDFLVVDSLNNRVIVFPQGSTSASRVLGQTGFDYTALNLLEGRELFMAIYRLSPAESGDPRKLLNWAGALVVDTRSVPHLYIADTFNNRVLGYCDARKAKARDTADLVIGQPDFFQGRSNVGAAAPSDRSLSAPTALAVDADGNLFVADTANARVLRFLAPCDQPSDQQSFPHANLVLGQADFTSPPITFATRHNMSWPSGVALTPEGYLAVSDAALNRVLLYQKPDGGDFSSGMDAAIVFGQSSFFGSDPGNALNRLNAPQHIAMDDSARLYVCDYGNNRVLIFSGSAHAPSNSSAVIAITNSTASVSLYPRSVYVNPTTGEVWISSLNYLGVLRYPNFENLQNPEVGSLANGIVVTGVIPLAAVLDARGNLVVAEAANRIAIYSPRVWGPVDGAAFLKYRALTPGIIATLWAPYQAAPTWAGVIPLPRELAGLQVLVNGTPSPLFYVGDDSQYPGLVQINFQVPMSAPSTGTVDILVVEAATQAPVGAGVAAMAAAAPALFSPDPRVADPADPTCRELPMRISAYNGDDKDDPNRRSCNGPIGPPALPYCPGGYRPVKPGEVLEMYLTGAGFQSGWPVEGALASEPIQTDPSQPRILLGTDYVPSANILYSGVAPCCAGLWQIDFRVPNENIAPTQANPIYVYYREIVSRAPRDPSCSPSKGMVPNTVVYIQ